MPKSSLDNWVRAVREGKLADVGKGQRPPSELELELARTRKELADAMVSLPDRVEAAIDTRLRDAADQAANTMLSRWHLANQAADRAAKAYQLSVSRLIGVVVTIFSLGVVAGALLATWMAERH